MWSYLLVLWQYTLKNSLCHCSFLFGRLIMSWHVSQGLLAHKQHLCLCSSLWPPPHTRWKLPSIIQSTYYVFPVKTVSSGPLLISTLPLNFNFLNSVRGCLREGGAHDAAALTAGSMLGVLGVINHALNTPHSFFPMGGRVCAQTRRLVCQAAHFYRGSAYRCSCSS